MGASENSIPIPAERICIVGGGGLGVFLTASLAKFGRPNLLLKSSQLDQFASNQLIVTGDQNLSVLTSDVRLLDDSELKKMPEDIWYWVCTKAYDLDKAIYTLKPSMRPTNRIVLLSNGLNLFMQAAQILERRAPMLRLLTSFGVTRNTATEVQLNGALTATTSALAEDYEILTKLEDTLTTLGFSVSREKDIATAEWRKALLNMVVNTLCTLVNKKNGALCESERLSSLAETLLLELQDIARKEGFAFDEMRPELLADLIAPHAENINSTLQDIRRGSQTETDYLLGRAIRLAREYEVATPVADMLYLLLRELERK